MVVPSSTRTRADTVMEVSLIIDWEKSNNGTASAESFILIHWGIGVPAAFDPKVVSTNPQSREREAGILVGKVKGQGSLHGKRSVQAWSIMRACCKTEMNGDTCLQISQMIERGLQTLPLIMTRLFWAIVWENGAHMVQYELRLRRFCSRKASSVRLSGKSPSTCLQ